MKKYLYAMLTLLGVLACSCTNDDIVIERTGEKYTVTYNVSVQSLYDEFNMTESLREYLRENTLNIAVWTYLYDSKGNLVESGSNTQQTYNVVSENFDLEQGQYTAITVVTAVSGSTGKSWDWEIADTEKLSTIKINQIDSEAYWYSALGVASQTINVVDDMSVNAVPKAIGSIINLEFFNYDNSEYKSVAFGTDDIIASYLLDPSLSKADRYVTDLTSVGIFNSRCTPSVNDRSEFGQTLYFLETKIDWTFYVQKPENEGTTTYTYWNSTTGVTNLEDGTRYYGGSYFIDSTTAPSCYVGTYSGYTSWLENIENSIYESTSDLVPSVYLQWGNSVTSVQAAMAAYSQLTGSYGNAVLQEDGSYAITFDGKGKENSIWYSFTSATTGLFEVDVLYDKTSVTFDELLSYAQANYIYLTDTENIYMYATQDFLSIVIIFEIGGSMYDVGFVDVDYVYGTNAPSRSRGINSAECEKLLTLFKDKRVSTFSSGVNSSINSRFKAKSNRIDVAGFDLEISENM